MLGKCKHYYCHETEGRVSSVEWRHWNAVRHNLDLHFQGNDFSNVNISKTVRASEKRSSMTFINVDICNRRANANVEIIKI